ncbi:abc transporter [Ceraceosorus bombacis]|uniref:Abc transporter n=1 Tax=Ceraceosorus bombacis TaxID=401625 RepID=A0A0P1BDQ2_9BASI|nr:abc transporter [Ceraceosorus bombacis]
MTPELHANWWNIVTFSWLNKLLTVGYTRPLTPEDLYRLQDSTQASEYADRLEQAWQRQCLKAQAANTAKGLPQVGSEADKSEKVTDVGGGTSSGNRSPRLLFWRRNKATKPQKPSLAMAMNETVLVFFWTGGFLKLLSDIGTITSPLLLRSITDFVTASYDSKQPGGPTAPHIGQGIGLGIGLFLVQLTIVFLNVHSFYRGFGTGILLRTALIHAIYRRAMRLSNRSRVSGGLGNSKLVTLISADVSRIDYCCQFFHMAWTSIVQIAICLALQIYTLGYSALPGFAFVLLLSPSQSLITKHLFSLRKRSMKWTDARVRAITELMSGIRTIKCFAWESPYLERIKRLRANELSYLRRRLGWRSANNALAFAVPTVAAVISFITYTAVGNELEPGKIFSALTFFQLLRTPLQFLPVAWNAIADATNACRRISAVFEGELAAGSHPVDENLHNGLEMYEASFEWDSAPPSSTANDIAGKAKGRAAEPEKASATPSRLQNITMNVPRGSLVAIVGPIGSGKSSLMSALAGEMRQTGGSVVFGGSLGLCAQVPWILSSTIRDNITFGRPYDEARYRQVVHDACLLPDFAMLPQGDQTVVGEKGVSLSGGQKQRVNIARAVYHDDDVILFDDCFSALDAHVGKAVFTQVMQGSLSGKTRILATHALHLLPHADYIITLEGGRIAEQGTYGQLLGHNGPFSRYVEKYGGALNEEKAPEPHEQDDAIEGKCEIEPESNHVAGQKGLASGKPESPARGREAPKAVMQLEERFTGSVSKNTYGTYLKAGNMPLLFPLFVLAILVFEGSTVLSPLWLLWWQEKQYNLPLGVYMGVYGVLGVGQALGLLAMGQVFAFFTFYSSATLHRRALQRVCHATCSFFDTTPLGRITHRFSKDVDVIDNVIGDAIRTLLGVVVQVVGSIVLIAYLTPYFLIAVGVMVLLYFWTGIYYRTSARELRRLDAVLRSKMYEHFAESLSGITTIRAYNESQSFLRENAKRIDVENRAYWLSMACQRWLSVRLDGFGSLLVLAVAMLAVGARFTLSPGQTGVALSFILTAQSVWSWVIRQSAEVENNMSAIERLVYYANNVEMEPAHKVPEHDSKLAPTWPSQGQIEFKEVVASYREGLPAVLKGVSLHIAPGEHIAVCGRTGAGKTTLMTTLLRMMELSSGSIFIDGVDISNLGLATLRSRISIIPQDPLMFGGSLRHNLDPLGECDDATLNNALQRACLLKPIGRTESASSSTSTINVVHQGSGTDANAQRPPHLTLDTAIEDEGSNLSQGQRALISMARALVRHSQIVVLDEATASVDYSTDAAIQRTISVDMVAKTVLTVAHRLNTVISYDRVCIMDAGKIVEIGPPLDLWERGGEDGHFRRMCDSSNIAKSDIESAQRERQSLLSSSRGKTS